jgi:hypothetical protein
LADPSEAIPANNIEAEQSTLGSMMLDPEATKKGMEVLRQYDFYRPVHAEIFDALTCLFDRDSPIDLITLQEELRSRCKLEECGGTEYLMALVESVPTAANIDHYARIVADKSFLRNHSALNLEYRARCAADGADPAEISAWLAGALEILNSRSTRTPANLHRLEDILCGDVPAVEWTVKKLIPKHGITMISGDPTVGKSWMVIALALSVAGGMSFLDKFPVTQTGVIVYDVEHGEQDYTRRTRRVYEGFIHEGRDFPCNVPVSVSYDPFRLYNAGDVATYARLFKTENTGLVICDPFVHCLPPGADENSAVDVAHYFDNVRRLQSLTGVCFVFVHHSRKRFSNAPNDGAQCVRGSSAIFGVLDAHLSVRKLTNGPMLIEHDKLRQGVTVEDFSIVLEDYGSATVVGYGGESNELADQVGVARAAIERMLIDNKAPMLREQIMAYAKSAELSQSTVKRALKDGVADGWLAKQQDGKRVKYGLPTGQGNWWSPGDDGGGA